MTDEEKIEISDGSIRRARTPFKFDIEYRKDGIFASRVMTNVNWIKNEIENNPDFLLFYVFHTSSEKVSYDNDPDGTTIIYCKIGDPIKGGYIISKDVLSSEWNLTIRNGIELNYRFFTGFGRIKTMAKILDLIKSDVTIGNEKGDLSKDTLARAINRFPTDTEIDYYIDEKVSSILSEELELKADYSLAFDKFLKKRRKGIKIQSDTDTTEYDIQKFTYVRNKLISMINTHESYNENDWQNEIAKIVCILFPQYVIATRELTLTELFEHSKRVDFLLIDGSGYVDVMEIKEPSIDILRKNEDHNNIVSSRKLSDCVTQVENYLFALLQSDNDEIEKKIKKHLSTDIKIHILNPHGLIIMGYKKDGWTEKEFYALEIIRRQYAHISDVITYNDLLERLNNIINQLEEQHDKIETDTKQQQ